LGQKFFGILTALINWLKVHCYFQGLRFTTIPISYVAISFQISHAKPTQYAVAWDL